MKKVLSVLSICMMAGVCSSAYAVSDPLLEKPPVLKKSVPNPVFKDQKPDDGLSWMDNLTGNLTWTSNYIFRGVSQTRNLPAIQGGLTYTFPWGIYANMWGSNVKFEDSDATVEIDGILGFNKEIGNFTMDINVARFFYPSAQDLSYNELNTLFNYYFLQFGVSYSADVYATHQSGTYYQGGINYDIPSQYFFNVDGMNFTALYGHYNLPVAAGDTYDDYLVSVSKKLRMYTGSLIWTSTNGEQHLSPIDGSTFTVQLAADF